MIKNFDFQELPFWLLLNFSAGHKEQSQMAVARTVEQKSIGMPSRRVPVKPTYGHGELSAEESVRNVLTCQLRGHAPDHRQFVTLALRSLDRQQDPDHHDRDKQYSNAKPSEEKPNGRKDGENPEQ